MPHIFLSYAREDASRARRIAEALRIEGFDIWWDARIETGEDFENVIRDRLTSAAAVVVLWSHASVRSKWVRAEAQLADVHDRLIPAMIDAVDPPLPFNRLETALIHDWDGGRDHIEYKQLVATLSTIRERNRASAAMTPDESYATRPNPAPVRPERPHTNAPNFGGTLGALSDLAARLGSAGSADEILVRLTGFAALLTRALRDFPERTLELRELIFDWHSSAEGFAAANSSDAVRRILEENRRTVKRTLDDAVAGGLTADLDWPTPLPWLRDLGAWSEEVCRQRLGSDDELQRAEAVDGLVRQPFERMQSFLSSIEATQDRREVHAAIWENWPRIRLYHPRARPTLARLLERQDPDTWQRRMATFQMLESMETADEVDLILGRADSTERGVFFETLLDHTTLACRQFALDHLSPSKRWNTLICPSTHIVIVREIVAKSIADCDPDFIKAVFLLILPRLTEETRSIGIRETYRLLCLFADAPLFLQDTFFGRLLELRKSLRQRVEQKSALQHLEADSQQYFESFFSQGRLKDVDITRMTHVPPPIQRLLAHEGHFPRYFICNYRDVIALETVPHVQRRPDFVEFLRLKRINGQALEKLVSDKLLMREYVNKLTFCRNPKARTPQLMEHLRFLHRTDLRALSRDKNASTFAREHANRIVSRVV